MGQYRNYFITLEHVTDRNIDVVECSERVTLKAAIKEATRMSKSRKAKNLWNIKNHYGELPTTVRVWVMSDESSNPEFVWGVHTMEFVDGKCTHNTVG